MTDGDNASFLSKLVLVLCIVATLTLMVSGLGSRWELWGWQSGLAMLRWATMAGLALAGVSLLVLIVALVRGMRRDVVVSAHALVLMLIPVGFVLWHYQAAQTVPPIHDITTDPDDPPEIRALEGVPERSLTYDRDEVYPQQSAAYPDIQRHPTDQAPRIVFDRALQVAQERGWEILETDENEDELRFHALDRTFWFGFEDDVVVRVRSTAGGSVLDIRSVSRVGRSDIGTNARRIRNFVDALDPGGTLGWRVGDPDLPAHVEPPPDPAEGLRESNGGEGL